MFNSESQSELKLLQPTDNHENSSPRNKQQKEDTKDRNLNLPKEGKPKLIPLENPKIGQLTPTAKSNVRVTFSDEKIPIEKELSHRRKQKRRRKRTPYYKTKLRRSTRNSRQNIVKTTEGLKTRLFNTVVTIGSLMLTNIPVLSIQGEIPTPKKYPKVVEELSEEKEELPEMLNDPKARHLRQYHQVLELATTIMDSED